MERILPGTLLTCPPEKQEDAFSVLAPIFAVSGGGLLLSQVSEMTGLASSTIQNWVKRGWVSNPVNKRYGEIQVARILIINLLRPSMQLDKIAALLAYVNGSVNSREDDSLSDPGLYSLLCTAIFRLEDGRRPGQAELKELIAGHLRDTRRTVADAETRLFEALSLMLLNIEASLLMRRAEDIFQRILGQDATITNQQQKEAVVQ